VGAVGGVKEKGLELLDAPNPEKPPNRDACVTSEIPMVWHR
jgi:hypothetical protein